MPNEVDFIDVSSHNVPIDGDKVRSKVSQVWVRYSIRVSALDPAFWSTQEILRASGVTINAYHLWDSTWSAKSQAMNFKRALNWCPVGDRHTHFLAVDVEETSRRGVREMNNLFEFMSRMSDWAGKEIFIYTSRGLWNPWHNGGVDYRFSKFPLWLMDYSGTLDPEPPVEWEKWTAHQFSGSGNGRGKEFGVGSGSVDLNRWNKE